MVRVEIIGPKGLFQDVVGVVHDQGRLHIDDLSKKASGGSAPLDQMQVDEKYADNKEQIEELLLRVCSILKALDCDKAKVDKGLVTEEYVRLFGLEPGELVGTIGGVIGDVEERVAALTTTCEEAESEIALLERCEPALSKAQSNPKRAKKVTLPEALEGMPLDKAYKELKSRKVALSGDLGTAQEKLDALASTWAVKLVAMRDALVDRSAEAEAIPMFGRTDYAFVIDGWIPTEDVSALEDQIKKQFGAKVIVAQHEIKESEYSKTPVALKNNSTLSPFEMLVGVYGMPKYGTLDPTWMIFLFYPLFFGLIVGDVGYGAVMLGIALWMRAKFKNNEGVKLATSILTLPAISVIVFGVIYGELFGDLGGHYLKLPVFAHPPFHRVHEVMPYMIFAIGVGVVHVIIGLILGVVNAIKTKNGHHLQEKIGILIALLGVASTAVGLALFADSPLMVFGAAINPLMYLGIVVILGGIVYACMGGGVMGVIEFVESVAHMASYIRIMAVGLGGAIFADAVNSIVAGMGGSVGGMIGGAIVGLLLHALNFAIVIFSPSIHSLRLVFLEFYGKFYETGSKVYSPFRKTGGEEGA
ncbi:MAG: hypothetical protein FWE94_03530 [Coriobacteriia bacterium]|nr:hypothetical protein [Coriobacteriia bacterium]